jgi:hypothetical protein
MAPFITSAPGDNPTIPPSIVHFPDQRVLIFCSFCYYSCTHPGEKSSIAASSLGGCGRTLVNRDRFVAFPRSHRAGYLKASQIELRIGQSHPPDEFLFVLSDPEVGRIEEQMLLDEAIEMFQHRAALVNSVAAGQFQATLPAD